MVLSGCADRLLPRAETGLSCDLFGDAVERFEAELHRTAEWFIGDGEPHLALAARGFGWHVLAVNDDEQIVEGHEAFGQHDIDIN